MYASFDNTAALLPHVRIAGVGSYVPAQIVTNRDLEERLSTTDEWIISHTGIRQRHIAAPEESAASMGAEAARRALTSAGIAPDELALIVTTTSTADYATYPATAALIQAAIGAKNAGAFDLNAACTGFAYGVAMAKYYCQAQRKPVLVVASEVNSRILDWTDRSTCILFGDGAGAAVLTPSKTPSMLDEVLGADGTGAHLLYRDAGCRTKDSAALPPGFVKMDGRAVFQFAVRAMERVIRQLLERNDLTIEKIDHIVPHQANGRILAAVAKNMSIPQEKYFQNIDRVANTSSAAIPIALAELATSGKLRRGDLILTVAFGAGLTYGGSLIRW